MNKNVPHRIKSIVLQSVHMNTRYHPNTEDINHALEKLNFSSIKMMVNGLFISSAPP